MTIPTHIKTNGKLEKGYYYLTKDMDLSAYGDALLQLAKEHKGAELADSVFDGKDHKLFGLTKKGALFRTCSNSIVKNLKMAATSVAVFSYQSDYIACYNYYNPDGTEGNESVRSFEKSNGGIIGACIGGENNFYYCMNSAYIRFYGEADGADENTNTGGAGGICGSVSNEISDETGGTAPVYANFYGCINTTERIYGSKLLYTGGILGMIEYAADRKINVRIEGCKCASLYYGEQNGYAILGDTRETNAHAYVDRIDRTVHGCIRMLCWFMQDGFLPFTRMSNARKY